MLVTPVPEYTPPAGNPPASANGDAFTHTGLNAASVGAVGVPVPMLMFHAVVKTGNVVRTIDVVSHTDKVTVCNPGAKLAVFSV